MFWCAKSVKFHFRWGTKPLDQNRRLRTIVTSIQDSKPREKQISQSFSYCELINLLRNGTIVRCLWENKKTLEKSVFCEATSQSFPVSYFWCRGFVPYRKWNLMLLVHQNSGKENRYGKKLLCYTYEYIGEILIEQIKKSVIYTLIISLRLNAPINVKPLGWGGGHRRSIWTELRVSVQMPHPREFVDCPYSN